MFHWATGGDVFVVTAAVEYPGLHSTNCARRAGFRSRYRSHDIERLSVHLLSRSRSTATLPPCTRTSLLYFLYSFVPNTHPLAKLGKNHENRKRGLCCLRVSIQHKVMGAVSASTPTLQSSPTIRSSVQLFYHDRPTKPLQQNSSTVI